MLEAHKFSQLARDDMLLLKLHYYVAHFLAVVKNCLTGFIDYQW